MSLNTCSRGNQVISTYVHTISEPYSGAPKCGHFWDLGKVSATVDFTCVEICKGSIWFVRDEQNQVVVMH